jgi:hypothetical protein
MKGLQHPFTDWQTCTNAITRILDDGKIASENLKLKRRLTVKTCGKTIKLQMKRKPPPGYRKIVLVVEDKAEPKGIPSDFHFYAQNRITVGDFYNQPRVVSLCCGKKIIANPYEKLNMDYNMSNFRLESKLKKRNAEQGLNTDTSRIRNTLVNPLQRSETNINLHIDMVPKYAVLKFIPRPLWLIDIYADSYDEQSIKERCNLLISKLRNNSGLDNILKIELVKRCCKLSLKIIKGKLSQVPKSQTIGMWSHKLGWGTVPLNTDGNGKFIFDPSRCNRKHGHYSYGKTCQAFNVLCGYGVSSKHGLKK